MPDIVPIAVSDLRVDEENPRLAQPNKGQHETLRAMAALQDKKKLQTLAEDILRHGLDPSEITMVVPYVEDSKKGTSKPQYVVIDGNRRLTAIRALENPQFLVDAVPTSVVSAMKKLSEEYQSGALESIPCLIFKNRAEADHWIELKHTGYNEGAGPLGWGSEETGRFRARRGGRLDIRTQALDLLMGRGDITLEFRKTIPTTTFKRLIDDTDVQERLGITLDDGQLKLLRSEEAVAKALKAIANDLATHKTKVSEVYYKPQKIAYINKLPQDLLVPAKKGTGSKGKQLPTAKPKIDRDKLIPFDCSLNVTDPRLRDIEQELRALSLKNHTNAVSVLFRVFMELSADDYITRAKLTVKDMANLGTKVQNVTSDLVVYKHLSKQAAKPVNKACQKDSYLGPSITLFHDYIHNQYMFPTPLDLRNDWNSLQPWFSAVWAP